MRSRWTRWLASVALVALAGMAGAAQTLRGSAANDLRVVQDAAGRFEISVPASWMVRVAPRGHGTIALVARARDAAGGFAPNVTVVAEDLPPATTAEEYGGASMASLRSRLRGLRVLSEGQASVGGAPGYARAFTWIAEDGTPVYAIQAYLVHDGLGLIATGSTRNTPAAISRDARILRDVVLSLRALDAAAQLHSAAPGGEPGVEARRDLFAPPPGASSSAESGQAGGSLPPVPSAGGAPLPPLPPATPVPPPPLGGAPSPSSPPAPRLPRLAAVVLGPAPQAVLRGADGSYAIVHRGEHTSWGTIEAIRASGVVLSTPSGTHTLVWSTGGSQ
jgi:hypothetical protein